MDTSRFVRFAPLSGLIFFVFALAGAVTMGSTPEFPGKPAEWVEYFTDDKQRVILGAWLMGYGLFFLYWFLGSLAAAARRAEGGDGRISRLAYGGGLAGTTLVLAGTGATFMAGLRVDDGGGISEDVATVYGDLFSALGFIAAPFAFAALVGGITIVNSRTPFLPAWLTWVSALLAIALLVPLISWAAIGVLGLWFAVVSILLFFRDSPIDTTS
ncbi:MAG: hypothetical protein M3P04_13695 [Actinomycetota bacterium]|nr:hypothetical protein [Actinomycetota bacterium]